VPAGTAQGDRSVKEAVASGLEALSAEHNAASCFGEDTRADTCERAAERIKPTRFQIESSSAYRAEQRCRLEKELAVAWANLRARVESLAAPTATAPHA
jgi:hypothetical protein